MINLLITIVLGVGLFQLAVDANSWPVWAVILLVLIIVKCTSKWGRP